MITHRLVKTAGMSLALGADVHYGHRKYPIFKNIAQQVMLLSNITCQMWVSETSCVNLNTGILYIHAARVRPRGERLLMNQTAVGIYF